jgi:hypothetical protein
LSAVLSLLSPTAAAIVSAAAVIVQGVDISAAAAWRLWLLLYRRGKERNRDDLEWDNQPAAFITLIFVVLLLLRNNNNNKGADGCHNHCFNHNNARKADLEGQFCLPAFS